MTTHRLSPLMTLWLILGAAIAMPAAGVTTLENDAPVEGLSRKTREKLRFELLVPAGASDLQFAISGGTGDADLYVSFDRSPTQRESDCAPFATGNEESCAFESPMTGTYHVMVYAHRTFSAVSLVASFKEPGNGGGVTLAAPVVSRKNAPNDQNVVYAMWRQILEIDAECSSERGTFVLQAQALAKIQHEMNFDDTMVLCLSDSPNPADCDDDSSASYAKWEIDREQPDIDRIVNTVDLQHYDAVNDCDGSKTFYLNAVMEEDNNGADEILAFDADESTGIIAVFYPR